MSSFLYCSRAYGAPVWWVAADPSDYVMDDFGSLARANPTGPHHHSLLEYDDAAWRAYWPAEMLPQAPKPARVVSPAAARELRRIEAKLEAWELQHLRALCAEQAERIESLEQALSSAQLSADLWGDLAREAQDALHEAGVGAMGITREGQALFMPAAPAPTAWQPV